MEQKKYLTNYRSRKLKKYKDKINTKTKHIYTYSDNIQVSENQRLKKEMFTEVKEENNIIS
jgi:hypothetical protein